MSQRAATIECLPMAFRVVKQMQADDLEWGEGCLPSPTARHCLQGTDARRHGARLQDRRRIDVLVGLLEAAWARLETRVRERAARERPDCETKVAARDPRSGRRKGKEPILPSDRRRRARLPRCEAPGCWRRARLEQPRPQAKCRLRKQIVEPVFGVPKWATGFTHFRLRGFAGAQIG